MTTKLKAHDEITRQLIAAADAQNAAWDRYYEAVDNEPHRKVWCAILKKAAQRAEDRAARIRNVYNQFAHYGW